MQINATHSVKSALLKAQAGFIERSLYNYASNTPTLRLPILLFLKALLQVQILLSKGIQKRL